MSESPTVTTLESLLRANSTQLPAATSTGKTSAHSASTTRPALSTSTWGSAVTGLFGYGGNGRDGTGGVTQNGRDEDDDARGPAGGAVPRKARPRASIPSWEADSPTENGAGHTDQGDKTNEVRDSLDAGADPELEYLADVGPPTKGDAGPLLVLACSRLPDPSLSVSHAKLLDRLVARLESFASTGPYSVVLLANPTPFPPSTSQLVTSYLSFSRATRKNLTKLWVVGGGWWTRVILALFNTTLLSLKASQKRKVVQVATLTALAHELDARRFTAIEFPLEVYAENAKLEKAIELPADDEDNPRRVFRVPLKDLCGPGGTRFPRILTDCLEVLHSQGPGSLGIFRRSPSASTVKVLELAYDRDHAVGLAAYPDAPYLAASLLKLFLRDLPDPILPASDPTFVGVASACPAPGASGAAEYVRCEVVPKIGRDERNVLERVVRVLSRVADASRDNLMTSANLVICLAPALIGGVRGIGGAGVDHVMGTIRVPGMASMGGGTLPATLSSSSGDAAAAAAAAAEGNSVGGVLKIMIDHCDQVFSHRTDHTPPPPSPPRTVVSGPPPPSPTIRRTAARPEPVQAKSSERADVRGIFSTSTD
ncbi:hypothetical protein JCM11491_006889 [Sporobolomyces phaffii]